MSETEIAWLAGFFDGEGHISVRVKLSQRADGVKIQVTNTNHALLERVAEFTGVGYITTRPRQSEKWRTTYDWHTTGGNAKTILSILLPWLIEKRDRAVEALS